MAEQKPKKTTKSKECKKCKLLEEKLNEMFTLKQRFKPERSQYSNRMERLLDEAYFILNPEKE